jgi:hypothetical protein
MAMWRTTPSSMVGQVLSSSTELDPSVTFATSRLCNLELYTSPVTGEQCFHVVLTIRCVGGPHRYLSHRRFSPPVLVLTLYLHPTVHCSGNSLYPHPKAVQSTCPALPMTSTCS